MWHIIPLSIQEEVLRMTDKSNYTRVED
jgi:hypothetical protein